MAAWPMLRAAWDAESKAICLEPRGPPVRWSGSGLSHFPTFRRRPSPRLAPRWESVGAVREPPPQTTDRSACWTHTRTNWIGGSTGGATRTCDGDDAATDERSAGGIHGTYGLNATVSSTAKESERQQEHRIAPVVARSVEVQERTEDDWAAVPWEAPSHPLADMGRTGLKAARES